MSCWVIQTTKMTKQFQRDPSYNGALCCCLFLMNQWLVSELFVRIGSLTVDVTWEIGLSLLWYEFVKATDHQYDKAISTRSCCIGSVWIVLFITFCFLFSFFFCFLTNFARAMTASNLWYDWIRNRSPMGQSYVILLFVHFFVSKGSFHWSCEQLYHTRLH